MSSFVSCLISLDRAALYLGITFPCGGGGWVCYFRIGKHRVTFETGGPPDIRPKLCLTKKQKRQKKYKKKCTRQKTDIKDNNIVMSGQFCTLAMFCPNVGINVNVDLNIMFG